MEIKKTNARNTFEDKIAKVRIADEPIGYLCNIFGNCEEFRCRSCGATLHNVNVLNAQLRGYIIDHSAHCRDAGEDSVKCENCAHYLGGIRCGK